MQPILFSLEQCAKCEGVKEMLCGLDIEVVTYPHDLNKWTMEQIDYADEYNVFEDLKITAPILVLPNGEKLVGYLRIRKWIEHETKAKI